MTNRLTVIDLNQPLSGLHFPPPRIFKGHDSYYICRYFLPYKHGGRPQP